MRHWPGQRHSQEHTDRIPEHHPREQGPHARVPSAQSRLQASTAEARDSHLLRINAPEIRAALTGVFGQRPVDDFGEIRWFGAREGPFLRGSRMSGHHRQNRNSLILRR
jgi:hypothetical protein